MIAFELRTDGLYYLPEYPEKEHEYCTDFGDIVILCCNTFCGCDIQLKGYRQEVERSKSQAIEVKNQQWIKAILFDQIHNEYPNHRSKIYFLPEGYKVEIEEKVFSGATPFGSYSEKLALISPS